MAVTFLKIERGKGQFIEFVPNDSAALTRTAIRLVDALMAAVDKASGLAKVRGFLARLVLIWQTPRIHWVPADWQSLRFTFRCPLKQAVSVIGALASPRPPYYRIFSSPK